MSQQDLIDIFVERGNKLMTLRELRFTLLEKCNPVYTTIRRCYDVLDMKSTWGPGISRDNKETIHCKLKDEVYADIVESRRIRNAPLKVTA